MVGAVVAIGLLATAMITQTNQNTATARPQEQELLQEATEIKPNEVEFRTGIPTLTAFETPYSDSIDYYQIKEGQYNYLDRAIQKGTTLISDSEINEYFETFSDKAYRFVVASNDGTTGYYTINYFEPPISLDRHNILISIKDNVTTSAKALPSENVTYLSEAIERPFRWVEIDDIAALALTKLIAEDGNTFNVTTNEGEKTVRLMYVGLYSEELKLPEFQTMYGLTTTSTGGQ